MEVYYVANVLSLNEEHEMSIWSYNTVNGDFVKAFITSRLVKLQ